MTDFPEADLQSGQKEWSLHPSVGQVSDRMPITTLYPPKTRGKGRTGQRRLKTKLNLKRTETIWKLSVGSGSESL